MIKNFKFQYDNTLSNGQEIMYYYMNDFKFQYDNTLRLFFNNRTNINSSLNSNMIIL